MILRTWIFFKLVESKEKDGLGMRMRSANFTFSVVRQRVDICKFLGCLELFDFHTLMIFQTFYLHRRVTWRTSRRVWTLCIRPWTKGSWKTSTSDVKLEVIQEFTTFSNKNEVRSFLDMICYYFRHLNDNKVIEVPLTNNLKGKVKNEMIEWSGEFENEFQELKDKLT